MALDNHWEKKGIVGSYAAGVTIAWSVTALLCIASNAIVKKGENRADEELIS